MGVILLLFIGLITAGYFYLRNKMKYFENRGIPCDPPSLLIGNLEGIGTKLHFTDNLKKIYEKFKNNHKVCGFYLLQMPQVIVMDLELVKNILIKDFHSFTDRGVYNNEENDPLSMHLFAIDGQKWKKLRRSLSVTFTTGRIKMMYKIAQIYSQKLVDLVDESVSNSNGIDLKNVSVRFLADVIGSVAFGIECDALKDENTEMIKMTKFFDIKDFKTRANFFFVNVFPDLAKKFNLKLTPDFIEEFFMRVIKSTYDQRLQNDVDRKDFMSLLMKIHKEGKLSDDESDSVGKITFNELAAQAFVFFAAGFETSSTTMTMALYELAYRPEIQSKLRHEINEVLSRHNNEMTYEAIQEMTYLDQVVNETMRLYSPIGMLFRCAVDNYQIPETQIVIEKGTKIIIPVCAIHLDSRYYYDPLKFDPSRFTQEESKKRPNAAFLPFGDGPRNCIGMRFGLIQTKLGIASMIKNFNFEFHKDTSYPLLMDVGNMLVSPHHPLKTIVNRV